MKKRDVVLACMLLVALGAALPLASIIRADPETVTVTYVDGRTDKGELIDKTPDKIVIRLTQGVNHLDIPIPWARIARISNGLTRADEISQWKTANAGKLCPDCGGDRVVACTKCGGTGVLARAMIPCKACNGTGNGPCTQPGCVNGEVDCPGPCLKLSVGKWETIQGMNCRKFTYGHTWHAWSDHHLGEVIEYQNGEPKNIGKCSICNGTTKVPCPLCKKTGLAPCAVCKGAKEVPEPGPEKKCDVCSGKKTVTCSTCKGTGLKP